MNPAPEETLAAMELPIPPRSPWLSALGVIAGLLSIGFGLGTAAMGMGFANATASGTGAAMLVLGLWMLAATRGIFRRRPLTYIGLSLGWAWLWVRLVLDFPATGSSLIVALFLLPAVTLPLGVLWAICALLTSAALWVRASRLVRHTGTNGPDEARLTTPRQWVSLLVGMGCLALATFGAPQLVWLDRGAKLERLSREYAPRVETATRLATFGACTMVFLGYQLIDAGRGKSDPAARQASYNKALGDAKAEVDSIVAAGAHYIRVGASGDQLLEDKPDQENLDDAFMAYVRQTGRKLVLVDTQHPKALQKRKLPWTEFCRFQQRRIQYYQERYQPDVYFVVCEPMSYHSFALAPGSTFSADAWAAQLSDMCRLVKAKNPTTRTGICLLVMKDREAEWEVWSQMKSLPELDILSVEIYQPEDFASTRARLQKYGHPQDQHKQFWVAETYNGWALCAERRWDQDAQWVRLSADFAKTVNAEAVLVWTFGSFAPGGSFWDFVRSGRFKERWGSGDRLSEVGEEFSRQAHH